MRKAWTERVVPAMRGAVEMPAALGRLQRPGEAKFVLARARGRVVAVEDRGRTRGASLDLAPEDGVAEVWIQLGGPDGVDGLALRDGSGVISFDQFPNQLEFARVGAALARHVESSLLAPLLPALKPGVTLEVSGVSWRSASVSEPRVVLVPVLMTLADERP